MKSLARKYVHMMFSFFASPDLIAYLKRRQIKFDWLLEAGCHDGSDSLRFLKAFPNIRLYAFEPDEISFNAAKDLLSPFQSRIVLKKVALMSSAGLAMFMTSKEFDGKGVSVFRKLELSQSNSHKEERYVEASTIDAELSLSEITSNGVVWLDVEGSALEVLMGAQKSLSLIKIIQVEVYLHDISKIKKSDFKQVHLLLKESGFRIIFAPLHPGYSGDAIYARRCDLNRIERLRSYALDRIYTTLHLILYPAINRPR
jgi:FkbM family methyltransferase